MPPSGAANAPRCESTSEQINSIPLPPVFPCRDCRRDKAPPCFANRHHRDYRFRKLTNPGYVPTARNTTARCRRCTGEQVHELKCEGQCGLWKSVDAFSKTQRQGDKWCKDCVSWKTSLEPGEDTVAGPGQEPDPSDVQGDNHGSWDPEEGDDGDDYDDLARRLDTQLSAMSVAQSYVAGPAGADVASSVSGYVPPHLRPRQTSSKVAAGSSAPPSVVQFLNTAPSSTAYVPPHLRGIAGTASRTVSRSESRGVDIISTSSASNPWEDRESITNSSQTVGRPGTVYNAYDSTGQLHVQRRLPSDITTATPPPAAASRTAPAASTGSAAASQPPRANGNWARAVGTRNGGQRYVPRRQEPPAGRTNDGYDSDDSPDEM